MRRMRIQGMTCEGCNETTAMIHPHPTISEGLGEALLALKGKPLHAL